MGYALVVKGADFSAQSIGRVTYREEPTPNWMFGIGSDSTIYNNIDTTKAGRSEGPWIFGSNYSQDVSFAGKTITKLFIITKTDIVFKYGICADTITTAADFTNSKEELGTIDITSENINTEIDITAFTVPIGKTVYYESDTIPIDRSIFVNCKADNMLDGVARGIPGTYTNILNNETVRLFENYTLCIDFFHT